jgi:hypothetical protein
MPDLLEINLQGLAMPIASADILYRLSGGAANSSPLTSLGGVQSTAAVAGTDILDDVTSAEAAAGRTEYRCVYVRNNHGSLTLYAPFAWLNSNTPNTGTEVTIGLGTSAVNGTEQSVANETTAPAGVTFSLAASKGAGLALENLGPGQSRAVWIKRVVTAGAPSIASDPFVLRVEGDTA